MSNSQRIYSCVRSLKKPCTWLAIAGKTDLDPQVVIPYLKRLQLAKIIKITGIEGKRELEEHGVYLPRAPYCQFVFAKDYGRVAPRLTNQGQVLEGVPINQQMWNVIRVHRVVDCFDLESMSACTVQTARSYLKALHKASYLAIDEKVRGAGAHRTSFRYRLMPGMNTGPRAPMVMRIKSIYDPNTNQVVWSQAAQELIDEQD